MCADHFFKMVGVNTHFYFQAVKTNGYVCEALEVISGICAHFDEFSGYAIGNGSILVQLLTSPTVDGGAVPLTCTEDAAVALSSFLKSLSLNSSVVGEGIQTILMNTLVKGLGGFALRLLAGAVDGERRTVTAPGMSALQVSRTGLASILLPTSALHLDMETDEGSFPVNFRLPVSFGNDLFGETMPDVDIELSLHLVAPAAGNHTIVSGVSGITVLPVDYLSQPVNSLSQPIMVTIPLKPFIDVASPAQFECIYWNGWSYSSDRCSLQGIVVQKSAVVAVTCGCSLLSSFAVSYNRDYAQRNSLTPAGNRSHFESTAKFGYSTDSLSTTSSAAAGVLLVSLNTTGSFGTVSSFDALLQYKNLVQSLFFKSISITLSSFKVANDNSTTVLITAICWGGQCIFLNRRRDLSQQQPRTEQMSVDFEIVCLTLTSLTDVSAALMSEEFLSGLAHQMTLMAMVEDLGNWSVIESTLQINRIDNGEIAVDQRPSIKYNGSVMGIHVESADDDVSVPSPSNLNFQMVIGFCGLGGVILFVGYCVFQLYAEIMRRRKWKIHSTDAQYYDYDTVILII